MKIITLAAFLFIYGGSLAQLKLPRLISNNMILQHQTDNKLWGWARPGDKVTLLFNNKEYNAVAGIEGKWTIVLPRQQAGGPYEMSFSSGDQTILLKNILFGDVWICGGQSNMELAMERLKDKYSDIIAKASNPFIRQFEVTDKYNFIKAEEDLPTGEWVSLTPGSILKFSAVAYFFAADIYSEYKIPIGLINAAQGGSPAEAWISEEALKKFPVYYNEAQKFKNKSLIEEIEAGNKSKQDNWYTLANSMDIGLKNNWVNPDLNDDDWKKITIPGYWTDQPSGSANGIVWFRKEFMLNKKAGGEAKLLLGRMVDQDSVYLNGTLVGTTSYQFPPRRYLFSSDLLKEGKNELAVKIINTSGQGGFVLDKTYQLYTNNDTIDLRGDWKLKRGAVMSPLAAQTVVRWKPLGLYNAMIAPLTSYSIKGVIWYQGESNAGRPGDYADLMETLVKDWRSKWNQGDFPFLSVQLANYMEQKQNPEESNWAELREAQNRLLDMPNTGVAVAIDLGEWNDIHPLNKQDVGKRLALQARKLAYGEKKIIANGPVLRSMRSKKEKLILRFHSVGDGLTTKDMKELKGFAIAGNEGPYSWAKAIIKRNKVIVWNDTIPDPRRVRYAWADNPAEANLHNSANLPASPFQAKLD